MLIFTLSLFLPCAVQTESSCANVVSAAPCQSDPQQYETQFSRLRSFLQGEMSSSQTHIMLLSTAGSALVLITVLFVSDAESPLVKEVNGVLFPLFLYLHLDMARCGLKGAVDSFYGRFHSLFQQDPEQKAIVDLLRGALTLQVCYFYC